MTILVDDMKVLSHSIHPPPDKRHGLQNVASAREMRYLELMNNSEARERFFKRSQIIRKLRQYLDERVGIISRSKPPILSRNYGGAEARPFTTHLNALDEELCLRISPELRLKEALVAGFERVYEVGKQFRNEGMDATHQPEFTSVEVYEDYADYNDMMALTESILSQLAEEIVGSTQVTMETTGREVTINLRAPVQKNHILRSDSPVHRL